MPSHYIVRIDCCYKKSVFDPCGYPLDIPITIPEYWYLCNECGKKFLNENVKSDGELLDIEKDSILNFYFHKRLNKRPVKIYDGTFLCSKTYKVTV